MGAQKRKSESIGPSKRAKVAVKPSQTLYVNNLNDQVSRRLLKHNLYLLFSTYGDVIDIIIRPKMRGQAHIILDSVASASSARASLDKRRFFSKEMGVSYAKTKSRIVARAEDETTEDQKKAPSNDEDVPGYET
ncbi:putative U2 small nuclear ribonucleoprotein B'' [Meyerozyma sp. JA9]|nr:putative U2 small nuclear ribonucleoprotein B'' [Meyerozyma sp. JA9]